MPLKWMHVQTLKTSRAVVQLLRTHLQKNAASLTHGARMQCRLTDMPPWNKTYPEPWSCSFIRPSSLSRKPQEGAATQQRHVCVNAGCGANAEKACPRCMITYYCSHGCQKADSPAHKLRCVCFTDTAAGARFVEIDLQRLSMPGSLPHGNDTRFVATFSFQAGRGNHGGTNSVQERTAKNLRKKINSLFVVKVQVCSKTCSCDHSHAVERRTLSPRNALRAS